MKLASFFKFFSLPKIRSFSFLSKKTQARAARPAQKKTAYVRPYDAIDNPSPALLQARAAYAGLQAERSTMTRPSRPKVSTIRPLPVSLPLLSLEPVSAMFTEHQSKPSAQWSARNAHMAVLGIFAETPEVQAAAHLFGARIRVYMPNKKGEFELQFTANPKNKARALDLVLENQHYRWVKGGVSGNSFSLSGRTAANIQNVLGDGNCFFHCLAAGLPTAPAGGHAVIRNNVVSILETCENVPLDGTEGMTLGLAVGLG